MALVELLRTIEQAADAEVQTITAAGAATAAAIDAESARTRADRVATTVAAFAAERRAAADLEVTLATRAARTGVLTARAAMLERIREAVRRELPALVAADPQLGHALIAAALVCIGDAAGTLRCTPALFEAARAAAPAAIRVEADPTVLAGAVVELASGTRIDATLTALLDRTWPALACEALALERAR